MAMYKMAQNYANDELVVILPTSMMETSPENEVVLYDEMPSKEEVIEMHRPEQEQEQLSFSLPFLPGCNDEMLEISGDDELEEEEKKEEKDKSKVADQPKDLNWIKDFMSKIPKHKGENLGLERAKSYLNKGLGHLSKMIQEDHNGTIDISNAESARIVMEDGIERLEKELNKRKNKKASKQSELTKEAQKAAGVGNGGVLVTVPLIVSAIARACINGTVSGGKSIEDIFTRLAEKFKLTDREKVETIQLLADMNFPFRRDLFLVDDKDPYEYSSEKNVSFPANYQA